MLSARTMRRDETLSVLSGAGQALPFGGLLASDAPLAFRGGDTNLYRYVGNSPINGIDPEGLFESPSPGYTYPDYKPIVPPAQEAIADIDKNFATYKNNIINQIDSLFSDLSPQNPLRIQARKEANVFAEDYIKVVRKYLVDHPNTQPKYVRNAVLDKLGLDTGANCETWMSYITNNLPYGEGHMCKTFYLQRGHYQGLVYQHNFIVLYRAGYTPKVLPTIDPNIRILDPWPTLRPYIGPPAFNSYRQVPTSIPPVVPVTPRPLGGPETVGPSWGGEPGR